MKFKLNDYKLPVSAPEPPPKQIGTIAGLLRLIEQQPNKEILIGRVWKDGKVSDEVAYEITLFEDRYDLT